MDKLSKHIDEKLDILYNMITKGPYMLFLVFLFEKIL